jgi:tRNA threonylcarbamoyladenosine biosynthesis protein TsaB
MLLAIDTATRWLGLSLFDGRSIIADWGWRCQNRHTVELGPAVNAILQRTGTTVEDLIGIGIAIGPGSYTGLRVGLGFAKGLALSRAVPLIGVPTLDIVAAGVPEYAGRLVVIAEAGRSRVLAGRFSWQSRGGWKASAAPEIATWDELLENLDDQVSTLFAGEIAPAAAKRIRAARPRARTAPAPDHVRRPAWLAQLAYQRLRKGNVDDPATLAPNYLRQPAGA